MRVFLLKPIGYEDIGVKNIKASLVGEFNFPQG